MPTCEETTGYDQDNDLYIRCGALAVALVKHTGRDEGPYWMCLHDADHNILNRGAELVKFAAGFSPEFMREWEERWRKNT